MPNVKSQIANRKSQISNLKSEISNLKSSGTSFDLSRLRSGLKPCRLYWYPRLRSTNDHAATLRRHKKLYAPAVVLTGHQLAGRGRGDNHWWSNAGVLTVTFALPIDPQIPPHQIPLLAGLAVRHTAAALANQPGIQLKWPNDIVLDGMKLAGLLCERIDNVDLIGIGLNINVDPAHAPPALRRKITSLLAIGGKPIDPTAALIALATELRAILRRRAEQPFSQFVREYENHHALAGHNITVIGAPGEPPITGRCEGIDETGKLVVKKAGVTQRVVAGQVLAL